MKTIKHQTRITMASGITYIHVGRHEVAADKISQCLRAGKLYQVDSIDLTNGDIIFSYYINPWQIDSVSDATDWSELDRELRTSLPPVTDLLEPPRVWNDPFNEGN